MNVRVGCPLTENELEAVRLLSQGLSWKLVAVRMDRGIGSIQWILRTAKEKVGTRHDTALVATAIRKGWIQ